MPTPPLTIESKIRRPGGSTVTIGATTYHFKPRVSDGRHVAVVSNAEHQGRLLSIREGYAMAPQEAMEIGAPEESGADAVAPPEADGGASGKIPSDEVAEAREVIDALDQLTEEQLRETYEAELGRKPHPQAKRETLIASIDAERDAEGGAGLRSVRQ